MFIYEHVDDPLERVLLGATYSCELPPQDRCTGILIGKYIPLQTDAQLCFPRIALPPRDNCSYFSTDSNFSLIIIKKVFSENNKKSPKKNSPLLIDVERLHLRGGISELIFELLQRQNILLLFGFL